MRERIVVGYARCSSVYGGPEEGGWYYDSGVPVDGYESKTKVFFTREAAWEYQEYLDSLVNKRDKFGGVGMGGCGDDEGMHRGDYSSSGYKAVLQYQHPKHDKGRGLEAWPAYAPHYE